MFENFNFSFHLSIVIQTSYPLTKNYNYWMKQKETEEFKNFLFIWSYVYMSNILAVSFTRCPSYNLKTKSKEIKKHI